jgi:hypothetical protein
MQKNYAIPGLMSPRVGVQQAKITYTSPSGDIEIPKILGPTADRQHSVTVVISQEHPREKDVLYKCTDEDFYWTAVDANNQFLNLRIPADKLLLARGSYTVEFFTGEKMEPLSTKTLIVQNSSLYPARLDYRWVDGGGKNIQP